RICLSRRAADHRVLPDRRIAGVAGQAADLDLRRRGLWRRPLLRAQRLLDYHIAVARTLRHRRAGYAQLLSASNPAHLAAVSELRGICCDGRCCSSRAAPAVALRGRLRSAGGKLDLRFLWPARVVCHLALDGLDRRAVLPGVAARAAPELHPRV